jgi:hypothetical protein
LAVLAKAEGQYVIVLFAHFIFLCMLGRTHLYIPWPVFKSISSFVIIEMAVSQQILPDIIERADPRERSHIFRDRTHAGEVLADMLSFYSKTDAIVLAIQAGAVPVAAVMPERLKIPLKKAVALYQSISTHQCTGT